MSERVRDLSTQYELSNLFKPVTDRQKVLKEGLVSELKPIREGMKSLPKAIILPQFPSITAYDVNSEEEGTFPQEILHLDCGIRMISLTLRTRKQK